MAAGHVDPTVKSVVQANTVFNAVLDATAIYNWRAEIASKIDDNYDYGTNVVATKGVGPATIVVAASNSKNPLKADYACTGTNDHTMINTALSALPAAVVESGTATAGAATTATLAVGSNAIDQYYRGYTLVIIGGTGNGQSKQITGYVGSTRVATVISAWSTNPDATSTYNITSPSGKVVLLDGLFSIAGAITVPTNVTLEGQGNGTLLKIPNGNNGSYYVIKNADSGNTNITVRNLKIDGNKANNGAGSHGGISYSLVYQSTIRDVTIVNMMLYGINMASGRKNTIASNIIENNGSYGLYTSGSRNCIITSNTCLGNLVGIYSTQATGDIISNNICQLNLQYGMLFDIATDSLITANYCLENSQTTTNTYDNIFVGSCVTSEISLNVCRKGAQTNVPKYGINIDSLCTNVYINNNDVYSSGLTADIIDLGVGSIKNGNRYTTGLIDQANVIDSMNQQAVINGNMEVAQQGVTFSNPANGAYTLDMYLNSIANTGTLPTTITHTQNTLTVGELYNSRYCYQVSPNGAGSGFGASDAYGQSQRIENGTVKLCGSSKKITVSIRAKSSIGSKRIAVGVKQTYGTGGSPTALERLTPYSVSIATLTSTMALYTFTFTTNTLTGKTFGTNLDDYLEVTIYEMWGATFASSNFGGGTAETFVGSGNINFTQVVVNAGDVALPFQPKSFSQELQDCMRYYEKSYPYSVSPATSSRGEGFESKVIPNTTIAIGQTYGKVSFKVKKRITPTVTTYPYNTGTNTMCVTVVGGPDLATNSGSVQQGGDDGFTVYNATGVALTASTTYSVGFHWSADARL